MKTYTTLAPTELYSFLADYAKLYTSARKEFLHRVLSSDSSAQVVKDIQPKFGLNKRQANSIKLEIEGMVAAAKADRSLHIKTLQRQLKSVEDWVKIADKKLKKGLIPNACCLKRRQLIIANKRFDIHQKKRKAYLLYNKINNLKSAQIKVTLPSDNCDSFMIGSKDETAGNQIAQYDGQFIKIRVAYVLESKYGKYVKAPITFKYGSQQISAALQSGQALTYRFYCRDFIWYIAASCPVSEVTRQSNKNNGCLGIDLNPGVIGWTYVNVEGNLIAKGQFKLNLHSNRSTQTSAILSDISAQAVLLAESFQCPIAVEDLDFSAKKGQLREKGRKYARMLSGFAYSKWQEVLQQRCDNRGIQLIKLNPAYSSLIGLVKFMRQYGLSSDTAAAMVIARRVLRKSERVPAKYAYLLVNSRKHVWSHWYSLNKLLCRFRRHDYFTEPDRLLEVLRLGEEKSRSSRTAKATSRNRCKS